MQKVDLKVGQIKGKGVLWRKRYYNIEIEKTSRIKWDGRMHLMRRRRKIKIFYEQRKLFIFKNKLHILYLLCTQPHQ